ncbi:MAG: HpsJ family protein [Cyanosarcina radialis HA8281-LM2]|jgi:hypothetical protein|nr:HpsJ family protein [Cyanosarcina radialis HA8281-LM2]
MARIDRKWLPSSLLRPIGYCLLGLTLFDWVALIVPIILGSQKWNHSDWRFQTIGQLIDKVPVVLLAMALIFYDPDSIKSKLEEILLRVFHWMALGLAIFFLAIAPLLGADAFKLRKKMDTQINNDISWRLSVLGQAEKRVNLANISGRSLEDINNALIQLKILPEQSLETNNIASARQEILLRINQAKQEVRTKTEKDWRRRRVYLLNYSVKWFIGAIISVVIFAYIWRITR